MKPKLKLTRLFIKTAVVGLSAGTILSAGSALGFWADLNSLFFESYTDAKGFLEQGLPDFGQDTAVVEAAVQDALGVLDITSSDPIRDQLEDSFISNTDAVDLGEPPQGIQAQEIAKELDRQRARAQTESVMGETGQQVLQEKLDQVSVSILETQNMGDAAFQAISTQEALKWTAQQNVKSTELMGALHSEVINRRIDTQFSIEVMANVSQTLDEERRARLNQDRARAASALRGAAHVDLF